jgi:hypothetical protein
MLPSLSIWKKKLKIEILQLFVHREKNFQNDLKATQKFMTRVKNTLNFFNSE